MFNSNAVGDGAMILRKGKVIEVGNSCMALNQVKVRLVAVGVEVIAEILTWFAGSDKCGSVSVPQVGDEVLVGFVDGQKTRAVVLGSLFNSKNKPVAKVDKKNEVLLNVKTRKGNTIIVNDGSEETLEITNKAGDTGITIDFKEGTIILTAKEKVVFNVGKGSSDQMVIQSGKGVTSKSLKGKFNFDAKAGAFGVNSKDVQLKAITNMTCEGINTAIKGTTKTDVTSSGMMTVNGGVIKMG